MLECKSCANCKHRLFYGWDGLESCMWYEIVGNDEERMIKEASICTMYEMGDPYAENHDFKYTSASNRDYSPSNPWDAPGMSFKDFI